MEDISHDSPLFSKFSWKNQSTETATMDYICKDSRSHVTWQDQSSETVETPKFYHHIHKSKNDCSVLGFSLTSPDLVICAGSPGIRGNGFEETPEILKRACFRNPNCSAELSPERSPHDSDKEKRVSLEFFRENQPQNRNGFSEAEHVGDTVENRIPGSSNFPVTSPNALSINAGGTDKIVASGEMSFQEDNFFTGGDTIRTEARIGDGEGLAVYQTARMGNFSYKFRDLPAGNYAVDLHFAEIILEEGPPGLRIFNVFIQEEKVVSDIDIYEKVGSNMPLVLSDLEASINSNEGLSIRFEGVKGTPLVCGIVIKNDSSTGKKFLRLPDLEGSQMEEQEQSNSCNQDEQREMRKLKREYESLYWEQEETKKALEKSKREIEEKNKECSEAWMHVQELRNELMRKSMHVGSLAYAVEGQVKEKSLWFSSLGKLSEKLKILKMEHSNLSEEALQCSSCLTDINNMTTAIQSAIERHKDLERELCALKPKFMEEAKEKKQLYNKLLELKGNIRVFCRCRPLNLEEIASGASVAIDFESAKDGELTVKSNGATKKSFKFDSVFNPQADQADVFKDTAPFAMSVLDGYNVCIFAYGQTGTGKTFTMEGTEQARGVNYRILEELFHIITERQCLYRYEISVSVLEVYNEQIRDLLASATQPGLATKRLEIRRVGDAHHVPGLVEAQVSNMNEVWAVLHTGSNARAIGSTNANEHSSRSHCIHCVMVRGENLMNEECTRSKLWLVDLAGSERVAKTDVQGERLKETQNINKSLSALGDVISALATKSPHIPFRNSKLTHLLQDSLGGDSKTLMFVQISPNENDVSETLCSLNFASRVRGIELGPAKKQIDNGELLRQKQMVEKAKQDIKSKAEYIKKIEENILSLESKIKARDTSNKNLLDRVKELESQLLIERKLARQHVDTKIAEHQQQQKQQTLITKPPLGTRNIGNQRSPPESVLTKDPINMIRPMPFTENNNKPSATPLMDILKNHRATQKENRAELPAEPILRRTSGVSICTTGSRTPAIPAPRRNSLIPLPTRHNSFIPFPAIRSESRVPPPGTPISLAPPPPRTPPPSLQKVNHQGEEEMDGDAKENTPFSVRGLRSSSKFKSIFRRSIHKKLYIKSPLRGGVLGDIEKVRVSIGNGTRMAHRVLASNTTKGRHKQQQKEKERGWNHGITARTAL